MRPYQWLSKEETAKAKEKRESYSPMNALFQRIPRRDKKAFLNEQCKEIKQNRMGKSRDLFKEIGNTKGIFYGKMSTISAETQGSNRS